MEKNKFVIKKVPLGVFLSLLNNLYEDGADFIDLHGEVDGTGLKDNVTVAVPMEYMSKEVREQYMKETTDNSPAPPPKNNKKEGAMTEEELNNLLKNI
jgi:hypothetical protein